MCRTDNYILRITNTSLADGLSISANNSTVSFDTPDYLRKKGKCKITVVEGNIHLREGENDRIYNPNRTIFVLTSNIPMLGYYTETRGQNNVLGTSLVPYTGTNADDKLINAKFDDNNPTIFTCTELPPVIKIQRMVYDDAFVILTTTGDTVSGSNTIADIADVSNLRIGDAVSANGISAGTYISTIPTANSITVSKNATATAEDVAIEFSRSQLATSVSDKVLPFHVTLDIQFYEDMN